MYRRVVPAAVWSIATLAAIALAWFGVQAVLTSTAHPQQALPQAAGGESSAKPEKSTSSPAPKASMTSPRSSSGTPAPSGSPSESPSASASSPGSSSNPPKEDGEGSQDPGAEIKTYTVDGGRVTFAIYPTYAELVSANPHSGWAMESWKDPKWIRVDFTKDGRRNSVICSWNDHEPIVETDENAT